MADEQLVEVGNEVIAFPANMSQAQIEAILTNQSAKSSFTMGLGEPFAGAEQLAGKAAEYITSAGGLYPNEVSKSLADTNEMLRLRQLKDEEDLATARRIGGREGIDFARLGGNVLSPANLIGGLGAGNIAANIGIRNPAAIAAATGAGASLTTPVTSPDFWEEKTKQAIGGAVLGAGGQKVIEFSSRVLNPLISASEKKLRDLGITPTLGQTLGGIVQTTEDFLEVLPFVGGLIKNAKEDSYDSFRQGVLNKGLAKVDAKLPKNAKGYEAIQQAFKIKNAKYDEALIGTTFDLDNAALSKLSEKMVNASFDKPVQKEIYDNIITTTVFSRFGKSLSIDGQSFKNMESELNAKIFQYNKGDVNEQQIAEALKDTLQSLKSVFARQNPEKSSALRRVDSLHRDLTLIEDASKRSQTGKFTPENYNAAIKENAGGRKKRQFGRGQAYNQELATAGIEVLGNADGSVSHTAKQVVTGAIGGYGAYLSPQVSAIIAATSPLAYSKIGKLAADAVIAKRPEIVKQAGKAIADTSKTTGGLFAPELIRQYNIEDRKNSALAPFNY